MLFLCSILYWGRIRRKSFSVFERVRRKVYLSGIDRFIYIWFSKPGGLPCHTFYNFFFRMTEPIKQRPFCLRKGLSARFAAIALDTFLCLAVFHHVSLIYFFVIFTCLVLAKHAYFYYLFLFHLFAPSFFCVFFSYFTNHSQEGDHPKDGLPSAYV